MDRFIDQAIENAVRDTLARELPKIIDRKLPGMIEKQIRRIVANAPNTQLTKVGFRWAFYVCLKDVWPDIDMRTSTAWLVDYLDVPYGTDGYAWTAAGARELAKAYAAEFSEAVLPLLGG